MTCFEFDEMPPEYLYEPEPEAWVIIMEREADLPVFVRVLEDSSVETLSVREDPPEAPAARPGSRVNARRDDLPRRIGAVHD